MIGAVKSPAKFWQTQLANASGRYSTRAFLEKLLSRARETGKHSATAVQSVYLERYSRQLDERV